MHLRKVSDLMCILAHYEVRNNCIYMGGVLVAEFVGRDNACMKSLAQLFDLARKVTKE